MSFLKNENRGGGGGHDCCLSNKVVNDQVQTVTVLKQPEGTRENLSMQCSVIKGLDIMQAQCAHTHTHKCTHWENTASSGKHTASAHLHH